MKLAEGAFKNEGILPSVLVEKVEILPTDAAAELQEFNITLSLQDTSEENRLLARNYMLFVVLGFDENPFLEMVKHNEIVKDMIRRPTKVMGDSMKKFYLKAPARPDDIEKTVVNKGQDLQVRKKPVTFNYKCPMKSVKDLYIYAVTYLVDPNSPSPTGVNKKIRAMKIGKPTTETLIKSGKAPLTAAIFTLNKSVAKVGDKGSVWAGEVHYDEKLGPLTSPGGASLSVQNVSNQKVQDLRFMNDVKKLPFDNLTEKTLASSPRTRKDLATAQKITKLPGPVSDCLYSRSTNNALKIFFSIDYKRLAKANTKLGHLIRNKEALSSCFRIENVRLYRTRVAPNNIKPTPLTAGRMNIQGSSIRLAGATEQLVASLKDGKVKSIAIGGTNSDIMNFVATDNTMIHRSTGEYEYKVYIDMIDTTTSAVQDINQNMLRFLSEYNHFLAAADSAGAKGFDIKARIKNDKVRTQALNQQWKKLINGYMTSIEFVFGNAAFGEFSSEMWRKNLISMANPANGDIKAMRQVSEIVADFNTNLQHMFKGATAPTSANKFSVRSKVDSQNNAKRKIEHEHVFSSKYSPVASADEGTDYLDDTLTANHGDNFTNITFDAYTTRMKDEIKKFSVPRPNDPGINKFGFMSPKRLMAKGSVVDTSQRSLSLTAGNGILNASLSPNTKSRGFTPGNKTSKIRVLEEEEILGYADVQVAPNKSSLSRMLQPEEPTAARTLAAASYIKPSGAFTVDDTAARAALSGSMENKIKVANPRSRRVLSSKLVSAIVGSKARNYRSKAKVTARATPSPATAGSLMAEAMVQDPTSVTLNSSFGMAVNFNALTKIEYFDGYTITNGSANLTSPRWRIMTKEKFDKLQSSDTPALCRVVGLNKSLDMPNKYALPPYDSLFILGNTSAPPSLQSDTAGDFKTVIDSTYRKLKNELKNTSLNIESEKATVAPAYTRTPLQSERVVRTPKRKASQKKSGQRVISKATTGSKGKY